MPMGGGGTRFGNSGINTPKPLIELQGKPFFFWATQSVLKFVEVADVIFVVLQEHIDKFNIDSVILKYYPNAKIKIIPHILNGAVLTCEQGISLIDDDNPILFNDCDHAFLCESFYSFCQKRSFDDIDGALLTFISDNPAYSYVTFDENHKVTGTIEKKVLSNEAICGAYYFKNRTVFNKYLLHYLENCQYKEYFVSGIYNAMASDNCNIKTFHIDEHISFGTPDEYKKSLYDGRIGGLL